MGGCGRVCGVGEIQVVGVNGHHVGKAILQIVLSLNK